MLRYFFYLRENNIDFFRDHSLVLSEAKYKAKYGRGLKILTPKQKLQRLSIALAQVKPVNTSENLLTKIRQVICSLYRAKEINKKVCNMNSIML